VSKNIFPIDPALQLTVSLLCRTEKEIATVEAASAEDVDKAVKAARAAFKAPSWKKLSATERGRLLVRLSILIEERRELFASIDAWDNGQ
jgi:aldehyde dehydrogenase (NAD(P)+)